MTDSMPLEITTPRGHQFAVTPDPDRPGRYEMTWLTGPNEGYGFSSRTSDRSPIDVEALTQMSEAFMAEIDPETGYLA